MPKPEPIADVHFNLIDLLTHQHSVFDQPYYHKGLLCSHMGISVVNMTRQELIEFIGMLDHELTAARIRAGLA